MSSAADSSREIVTDKPVKSPKLRVRYRATSYPNIEDQYVVEELQGFLFWTKWTVIGTGKTAEVCIKSAETYISEGKSHINVIKEW